MNFDSLLQIDAKAVLESYDSASLQQMARTARLGSKNKNAIIKDLAKTLYKEARIHQSLDEVQSRERRVLDRLLLNGGAMTTGVLREQMEEDGVVERRAPPRYGFYSASYGSAAKRDSTAFEDIVARLTALGLVFTANAGTYRNVVDLRVPGMVLFIPNPIRTHLPGVRLRLDVAPDPPTVRPAEPDLTLRDQFILASLAREEPIAVKMDGTMTKRSLVRVDSALRRPEGAATVRTESELWRLPLLRALGEEAGILIAGPSGLRLGDDAGGFFAEPRGRRRQLLFEAYGRTKRWSELSMLPDITVSPKNHMYSSLVADARRRILAELAKLPGNTWFTLEYFIERLRLTAYEFLVNRYEAVASSYYYGSEYITHPYLGRNALRLTFTQHSGREADWSSVEGNFIRIVVGDALHLLGIVDLGAESADGPVSHFRITEGGAALLKGGVPAEPERPVHMVVQPNFQVLVFEPADESVLFTLDTMARRVRIEQVSEFHLSRESVAAAQRAGMDGASILSFLESTSSTPLAQNVRRSIEDWAAQGERIKVLQHTSLIQADEGATLDAIYADETMAPLLGRRLGPTAALVPSQHLQTVYARLVQGRTGLPLPTVTEGNDTSFGRAVWVYKDGRISPVHRVPSMYVYHALSQFADEKEDGALHLTRASLQRAVRTGGKEGGLTADSILTTLSRLSAQPLPPEVVKLVRRWAKNWGSGTLTDVTLLQVDTPEIMADLMADDELKPYLTAVPGAPTLAIVKAGAADRVEAALEERDMDLKGPSRARAR